MRDLLMLFTLFPSCSFTATHMQKYLELQQVHTEKCTGCGEHLEYYPASGTSVQYEAGPT
jgi:hypothetical protein